MKIAIVRLSALGDIIQSMVVLESIKKHYPNVLIDWFIDNKFKGLLENNENINKVHYINSKVIKGIKAPLEIYSLFKKLRNLNRYDLVIDYQGLIKSSIVSRFLNSKKHFGFDHDSVKERVASFLYSHKVSIPYENNVFSRYIYLTSKALNFEIPKENIVNKKSIFKYTLKDSPQDYIVLILGASFSSKIYPVENFIKIAEKINKKIFAVWYSPEEKLKAELLERTIKHVKAINTYDLNELIEVIGNSQLVIGGDTGPTHLAWAMNIPSITIFGSTPMERNFLETKINLGIKSNLFLDPRNINKQESLIKNIRPSQIIKLVKRLERSANKKFI